VVFSPSPATKFCARFRASSRRHLKIDRGFGERAEEILVGEHRAKNSKDCPKQQRALVGTVNGRRPPIPPQTVECGFLTLSIRMAGTQVTLLPGCGSVSDKSDLASKIAEIVKGSAFCVE